MRLKRPILTFYGGRTIAIVGLRMQYGKSMLAYEKRAIQDEFDVAFHIGDFAIDFRKFF